MKAPLCILTVFKKKLLLFIRLVDLNVRNNGRVFVIVMVMVMVGRVSLGLPTIELVQLGLAQVVDNTSADGVAHHVQHGPESIEKPVDGEDETNLT